MRIVNPVEVINQINRIQMLSVFGTAENGCVIAVCEFDAATCLHVDFIGKTVRV